MIEPSLAKTRLGGVPPNILDCTEGLSPLAAIQPWPRTEYNYDIASDPIDKVIDPIGSLSYRYDPVSDVLMSIYDSATPAPLAPYTHFSYDGLNRLTQVTYPNGMICTYSYGTDFRLAGISYTMNGNVIDSFAYQYDEVGNISRIDRPNWYVIYGYDLNNQLISADYEGSTDLSDEWYEYDPVGNRTASHISSYYVYDELNRLLEDEQHWYEWDNNGNMLVKGNKADGSFMILGYNPENKLRRVEKSDGTVIAHAYDAKGRRVIRSVNGTEERFHYDGEDVIFDTDGSDDITVRYVNLPGSVDQKVYATTLGDNRQYTYLRDHLGTIWKVLDSQGNVVKDYVYDSFGQVKGQAGSLPSRYTYTGREIEPESGLYYYRARFYDPEVGRFVSEDGTNQMSLYLYADNNPINMTDPLGLFTLVNFPLHLKQTVADAVYDAIDKIDNTCCAKQDSSKLKEIISNATIKYDVYSKVCGSVTPWGFITNTITLGSSTFTFSKCCYLSSTILHEAVHLNWGGERKARKVEFDCFGCTE